MFYRHNISLQFSAFLPEEFHPGRLRPGPGPRLRVVVQHGGIRDYHWVFRICIRSELQVID